MQLNVCHNFPGIFCEFFFLVEWPRRKLWAASQRNYVDETKLWSGLACYCWLCFTFQVRNTLTKETLSRNTCKASLYASRLMEMLPSKACGSPTPSDSPCCWQSFTSTSEKHTESKVMYFLVEMLWPWFWKNLTFYFPWGQWFSIHSFSGQCFYWTWLSWVIRTGYLMGHASP